MLGPSSPGVWTGLGVPMGQQIRVLIADDNPHARDGLRALLQAWPGIEVIGEAANGGDAVGMAGELQPAVVLMDLRMPVVDGVEATRDIKARWPQVKVVVLTIYPIRRAEALAAGADAVLLKGCSMDELLKAIVELSKRWQGGTDTNSAHRAA